MARIALDVGEVSGGSGSSDSGSGDARPRDEDVRARLAEEVELVRRRAEILNPSDRSLLVLYLEHGGRLADIARVAGVSEGVISRRVRRLRRCLVEGRYIACLRKRDRLTPGQLALARDYFVDGLGISGISTKRGLTTYRVRKVIRMLEQISAQGPAVNRRRSGPVLQRVAR